MIYEPAEDSYLLQKWVKKLVRNKVLDIGCGSGIQSETALKNTKYVLPVDINIEAVEQCKEYGAVQSDLFSNVKGRFDWIIFNPPYLPRDSQEDEESAVITTGGEQGYEIIERFLKDAKEYLRVGGQILLVCSSLTGDVESMFKKRKYDFKLLDSQKVFFEELVVYLLTT